MEGATVSTNINPKGKPTLISARRTIPTSSYDLLEGTFQTATKARNFGIALVAAGFLLFGFVGTNGFISGSAINSINAEAEAARLGQLKVSNDLGKIDGYPKLSALALLKKDNQTKKDLYSIGVAQSSTYQILDTLQNTLVPGVSLQTVKFCSVDPKGGACGSMDPKDSEGKIINVRFIEITFSVADLMIASQWAGNIRQSSWLKNVDYTRDGGNVRIFAELVPDIFPQESLSVIQRMGFVLQVNSNPPVAAEGA